MIDDCRPCRVWGPGVLWFLTLGLALMALLLWAGPASAATVGLQPLDENDLGPATVNLYDAAGERNDIEMAGASGFQGFELTDREAPIRVAGGCEPLTANRVRCLSRTLIANLGGGDDRFTIADSALADLLELDGEAGDDRLFGGIRSDQMSGGPGLDELHGGRGDDGLRDDDSPTAPGSADDLFDGGPGEDSLVYNRRESVHVDLSADVPFGGAQGERDLLTGIENVSAGGGGGDDVLIGDERANILNAGPGNNDVRGGSGNDRLGGAGSLEGGEGDDHLSPARGPVSCGHGRDIVEPGTGQVAMTTDCERLIVRVPGGLSRFFSPRVDPVPRRQGSFLVLDARCRSRASDRRRCAGRFRLRAADGRALGSARFVLRGAARRKVRVRLSARSLSRLRPTSTIRVELDFGPNRGRTALTRWRVPVRVASPSITAGA